MSSAAASLKTPLKFPMGAAPKLSAVNVKPDRLLTLVSETFMPHPRPHRGYPIATAIVVAAFVPTMTKTAIAQAFSSLSTSTVEDSTQDAKFWATRLHEVCHQS